MDANDTKGGGFRGPMERQQISGGRHDKLSNARQREPGSSREEADLTHGRQGQTDLAQNRAKTSPPSPSPRPSES